MTAALHHDFSFDPSYGYDLDGLLSVAPPPEPPEFAEFWAARYKKALRVDPSPVLRPSEFVRPGMLVWDLEYRSTDDFVIGGWMLEPARTPARRAFVVGHGYGCYERPEFDLPSADAIYFVPCLRGLGRSKRRPISPDPWWHVLHDIHLRDRYIVGGCVEDVWTGVTALLALRPDLAGRVGYLGHSFGGGVGALALPWESRLAFAHLDVPTFGHQPLRLRLPTTGSAASVQAFARQHVHVAETLAFYDGAVAARRISQPMHLAAALFDPVVVPPGQFAIYNALPGPKELFVRNAGHFQHPGGTAEDRRLLSELRGFFNRDQARVSQLAQPTSRP